MTSVQNRLLQLSGNKQLFIVALFASLMFAASCKTTKPDPRPTPRPDVSIPDPSGKPYGEMETVTWKNDPKDPVTIPDPIDPKDPVVDPNENPTIDEGFTKASYNVVMMLPFLTDRMGGEQVPRQSMPALEFYEGALMAVNRLKMEGVNMELTVLDTKGNRSTTSSLLESSSVQNADLIIGPISAAGQKLAAEKALKSKTPMIGVTGASNITENNPFFVQLNPSYEFHAEAILNDIETNSALSRSIIISRADSKEKNRVDLFRKAFEAKTGDGVQIPVMTAGEDYMMELLGDEIGRLRAGRRDSIHIIIPSRDETFVSEALRQIGIEAQRLRVPVKVYGMEQWMDFNKMSFDYYERLNVLISSNGYITRSSFEIKNFQDNYFSQYKMLPGETVYLGYDIMLYVGKELKEHGTGVLSNWMKTDQANGLHTKFNVKPVFENPGETVEGSGKVNQFMNTYVHILRFKDYQFVK